MMIVIFFVVGVILSTAASFVLGIPWLMPIFGAAVPYPIFLSQVRRQQYKSAFWWMLMWGVLQSIAVIVATTIAPDTAAKVIIRGQSYTESMLHWIRTGEGMEGSLRLFLPDHLLHYGIFCILCVVTFSSVALVFGTWMLNYMNFYVAELVKLSAKPWLAAILGWYPWSILRIIGFIATWVALAALGLNLVTRIRGKVPKSAFPKSYMLIGIGFVSADIVVKAVLAPIWQKLLLYALS
ncbi:hypothetical protein FNW02_27310 [Komarekiella sp. 'clone 1']|uniref:Uncharacterized protein n=1 Tax=Komarekiella delphini-convector SJRDD-AB1 TaxID=2593771 RepID=A0AA40T2F7_9NOST|nr:hypothetical protein [Komarekiella delphini-convector]MBD6619435.1 hypothetical protein [Komarekiella delphini-convector SJRDD-AB1]